MRIFRLVLLLVHGFVLSRSVGGASLQQQQLSETVLQTAAVGAPRSPGDAVHSEHRHALDDDDYDYNDEEFSGVYGVELPRVAFSTKPKDLSVAVTPKKKGKGRKKDPCQKKYKDFCIHGTCRYLRELRTASCICFPGYSGERCHLFSLPVVTEGGGYNRTTALAVMAAVLSTICFVIIGILLALRCHKRGAYNVETEEKVKLDTASKI